MMDFLIKHGAKVDARNLAGETPLHRVAWKTFDGSNAVDAAALWLKPLLTSHANIAAADTNGPKCFAFGGKTEKPSSH
jgi:ankyrin repeat protein